MTNGKSRGIIFYTKPWRMVDEKTGQVREGVTVQYLMVKDFTPVVNPNGSKGCMYSKESIPLDKLNKITDVPAYYDFDFEVAPGSQGKMSIKLADVDYVGPVFVKPEKPEVARAS